MKTPVLFALVSLLAALSPPARSLDMRPLSVEELAGRAQIVLRGTVLSQSCQRDPEGRIFTKVQLQVAEVWKGALAGDTFTIVHGGGTLGERRSVVSGQAGYALGEEVVLFLVRNERGEGVTLGLGQGQFQVQTDPENGARLVHNPFHGEPAGASTGRPVRADGNRRRLTLAELKHAVQGGRR